MELAGLSRARIARTSLIASVALVACSGPEEDLFGNTEAASSGAGAGTASGTGASTASGTGAAATASSGSGGDVATSSSTGATGGQGGDGGVGRGGGGAGGEGGVPPSCGDQQVGPGEDCDGPDFDGKTCLDFGFGSPGTLTCTGMCLIDHSTCMATCGDMVIEPGEECDDGATTPGDGCGATCQFEGTTCDNAIAVALDLGPSQTFTGTTVGGGQHGSANCPGPALDRVYAVTAAANGYLTATLTRPATSHDTVLYAQLDCDDASTLVSCANSQGAMEGGGEVISLRVQDGQTLFVFVDGFAAEGSYELVLDLSTGESCVDPIPITVYEGSAMTFFGSTNAAIDNDAQSASCGGGSADDVVYRVVRPQAGPVMLDLDASYDSVLNARPACALNTNAECSNVGGNGGELIQLPMVTAGEPFFAWVDGFNGAEGEYALTIAP
jgi:cysteine-rich repeat protein